jgi:excisionase family DNA binding protein
VATDVIERELVTVRDAANFLGLGVATVYRLMDKGQLPYVKLGRSRRISREDLRACVQKNRVGGEC